VLADDSIHRNAAYLPATIAKIHRQLHFRIPRRPEARTFVAYHCTKSLISLPQLPIELRDASVTTLSDFVYGMKAHGWLVRELEMEGKRDITAVLEDRDIDELSGLVK
jgi:hypothetical protein